MIIRVCTYSTDPKIWLGPVKMRPKVIVTKPIEITVRLSIRLESHVTRGQPKAYTMKGIAKTKPEVFSSIPYLFSSLYARIASKKLINSCVMRQASKVIRHLEFFKNTA